MKRRSRFKYPILQTILIFVMALGAAALAAKEGSMDEEHSTNRARPTVESPVQQARFRTTFSGSQSK